MNYYMNYYVVTRSLQSGMRELKSGKWGVLEGEEGIFWQPFRHANQKPLNPIHPLSVRLTKLPPPPGDDCRRVSSCVIIWWT